MCVQMHHIACCCAEADESFMDTIARIRQAIGGPESEISKMVSFLLSIDSSLIQCHLLLWAILLIAA